MHNPIPNVPQGSSTVVSGELVRYVPRGIPVSHGPLTHPFDSFTRQAFPRDLATLWYLRRTYRRYAVVERKARKPVDESTALLL
jgi:hypothetical protein